MSQYYEDSPLFAETEEELFDYEGSKLIKVRTFFWVREIGEDGKWTGEEKRYTYTLTDKRYGEALAKFDFKDQSVMREAVESICQQYIEKEKPYSKYKLTSPHICGYVWDTAIKRNVLSELEPFSNALVELEDVFFRLKQECLDEGYSRVGEEYLVNYKTYLEESVSKLQGLDEAVKQLLSTYIENQS